MTKSTMNVSTQQWRFIALMSYLGLIVYHLLWHTTLSPHPSLSTSFMLALWLCPLMFPLAGILKGKPYTHAWANFILMLYFLHALTLIWVDEGERWLAVGELLIVSISFVANSYFARSKGRELGAKLEKLSVVEKREKAQFESSHSNKPAD